MQVKYFIQATVSKFFLNSYKLVGLRAGSYLGSLLGRAIGRIAPEGKLAARNIARALPHLTAEQQRQVNKELWSNLGRLMGEFPHLRQIDVESDSRLLFEGLEHIQAAQKTGKPIIILSGHFANWEMVMIGLGKILGPTGALYRAANNPYMEDWIAKQRSAFMPVQIQKNSEGARKMIELMKAGTPIAGLVDQRLNTGDPINFLGRDTRAPSAFIKLARRFEAPIVMTRIVRRDDGPDRTHFKQIFYPAFYTPQTDNMQADIDTTMRRVYDVFEDWIQERPADWFWAHNRWGD